MRLDKEINSKSGSNTTELYQVNQSLILSDKKCVKKLRKFQQTEYYMELPTPRYQYSNRSSHSDFHLDSGAANMQKPADLRVFLHS